MSDELDLRLQVDDVEDALNRALDERRRAIVKTTALVLRPEQVKALMRGASATERLHSIFGIPVIQRPDGLTPRERSIKRALEDFPPTREEQVAEILGEHEAVTWADIPPGF